jgi:threonine dehydratase
MSQQPDNARSSMPAGTASSGPETAATPAVTVEDVLTARDLLRGIIRDTPVQGSRSLSEPAGGPVWLKCENLQRAGSFKIRGAYTRISRLTPAEAGRGVVAASAGNHAQGVALAASLLGIRSTVFMPEGAPIPKVEATRAYGAEVRFHGHALDQALVKAQQLADETGAVFVHPFDHAHIVAGQGTVGLEILEQVPDAKTILVSTGGGGLLAGIATAVKAQRPDVRIVGVQAQEAAAFPASLAAGHPVALDVMTTMADGIAVGCPGQVPFEIIRRLVDDVTTVSEESLSRALLLCLERNKLVVEPAGAAGVAAMLEAPQAFETPVVVVLSGGNIDPLLLQRVLRNGLAVAGRFLTFRARIPDRPGALVRLLAEVAAADGSVLDVEHVRTDPRLGVHEVEVALQVETRGVEHCAQVVARLRDAGYLLVFG